MINEKFTKTDIINVEQWNKKVLILEIKKNKMSEGHGYWMDIQNTKDHQNMNKKC